MTLEYDAPAEQAGPAELDESRSVAPLRNMALFAGLVRRVTERKMHLPGMACFYGPSGYGKSFAAAFGRSRSRGIYVQVGKTWTKKTLVVAVARALGLPQKGSLPDLMMQVTDTMMVNRDRPILIDEADYLLKKDMIDIVREVHDESKCAIILIGEELLPTKLKDFERAHNRMMDWVPAVPCDLRDAKHLADCYLDDVAIDDDLLEAMMRASEGRARRISINLDWARDHAKAIGVSRMTRALWGSKPFHTGEPQKRRPL